MSAKRKTAKKSASKKTLIEKVSDTALHIKDEIITGKDHVVEFAGEAFDSIKEGVKHLVQKKKPKKAVKKKPVKKAAVKKTVKKSAQKKSAQKKSAPKKSAPKKSAQKKVVKKSAKKSVRRK
ncbi:MAG TPA: hypothetical protein VHB70_14005 [Parafilimonas sp.]|nr:hypothetical protein [Parafilimonas sp.]